MTSDQLIALATTGESETLEFKQSTRTRREATRAVCAMLNQHGGHVLFGVTPKGRVVGQQVSDRTIEAVSADIRRIEPPAFPSLERIPIRPGFEVVAITVSPGPARPYRYGDAAWCRVGKTTLRLSADEYNRMLFERMHSEQRWENQPASGWSLEDLDAAEIRRTTAEAVRRGRLDAPVTSEVSELLRSLGVLRGDVLLRAAAALFGTAERLELEMPQCLLRVARFRGSDRMVFLDNRQFNGNAFTLLSHAERFLRDTLPIAGRFEPGRMERIDEPLYPPPLATREALANALCHRDYSIGGSVGVAVYDDRLEVTSSGSLHFGLTPEELFAPHESLLWNPLIARTFYRRGIIEEWGRGTLKMAEAAASAGLPRPEIEDANGCVTVRFRPRSMVSEPRVCYRATRSRPVIDGQVDEERSLALRTNAVPPAIAVSISESPDMDIFGLSGGHLRDTMADIALTMLSSGRSLVYGEDLRTHDFTDLLFNLLVRYRGHPNHSGEITVTNYLAWPVHIQMTTNDIVAFCEGHQDSADLVFLAQDGTRMKLKHRLELTPHEPSRKEWVEGLTSMRTVVCDETQMRVVLGGSVGDFKGCMPDIAEEALLSLQSRQPLFLIGGFGGCTRDIAETLGLVDPWAGSRPAWPGRSHFERHTAYDLHNGLSFEENRTLARTPHIDQMLHLVLRGLHRLRTRLDDHHAEGIAATGRVSISERTRAVSLAERRAYMRLPLAERRKRLTEQAERLEMHYAREPERTEREAWQGGDIVEP